MIPVLFLFLLLEKLGESSFVSSNMDGQKSNWKFPRPISLTSLADLRTRNLQRREVFEEQKEKQINK